MGTIMSKKTKRRAQPAAPENKNQREKSSKFRESPTILFTGDRRKKRFRVIMIGLNVELTHAELNLLIELVCARLEDGNGYVEAHPAYIHRLRTTIDRDIGQGQGMDLIESGDGREYRLTMGKIEARCKVTLGAFFGEWVRRGSVSRKTADILQCNCKILARDDEREA
jgi:hypothetical protein